MRPFDPGITQQDWVVERTSRLVGSLLDDAIPLGLAVSCRELGETVIDCGINVPGSWEAGRRIVEIAQGGMSSANLGMGDLAGFMLPVLTVESWCPDASAYGFQVSIPLDEVDPSIRVSGPILARCTASRLPHGWDTRDIAADWGIAVVETEAWDDRIAEALSRRSGIERPNLTVIAVPSGSAAGVTQIAGRINECIVFTLEESLGIPSSSVIHMIGRVPIAPHAGASTPPVLPDDLIHYAGSVVLTVESDSQDLTQLAEQLVFASTSMYGRRFADLLAQADGVFENIPGLADLNKVAQVTLIHARTGRAFSAGVRHEEKLGEWMRASRCDTEGRP